MIVLVDFCSVSFCVFYRHFVIDSEQQDQEFVSFGNDELNQLTNYPKGSSSFEARGQVHCLGERQRLSRRECKPKLSVVIFFPRSQANNWTHQLWEHAHTFIVVSGSSASCAAAPHPRCFL